MTSTARLEANRRNARKSTGPKTGSGKKRCSGNALKPGLTAQIPVLPNEDPAAYQKRLDAWLDHYGGDAPAQAVLIGRAVHASWRLERCARFEAATLARKVR